jgi:hypothetical protein
LASFRSSDFVESVFVFATEPAYLPYRSFTSMFTSVAGA